MLLGRRRYGRSRVGEGGAVDYSSYEHLVVQVDDGVAVVRMNRPERLNAFNILMAEEMLRIPGELRDDPDVRCVILTGTGRGFCTGLDITDVSNASETIFGQIPMDEIGISGRFTLAWYEIDKPTIAAVNGVAIGGGHVLHVLCDLTIAADSARFGQAGPRVGSFDAGYGSAYLARILGDKRAREVWYLCRLYDAATMQRWGLVNAVVPLSELRAEVRRWADEMLDKSPTALKVLKHSFNADSESIAGLGAMAFDSLELFVRSDEAQQGLTAFQEGRAPRFRSSR